MSDMFNNYPQSSEYIPNNRFRKWTKQELTIMAGETTSHSFDIPFNVKEETLNCKVIYKLGLEDVITKEDDELIIADYDESIFKSCITCKLSPEETSLFANTLLKASVQLKFTMLDGSISYTEIYPVKLLNSLDIGNPAKPSTLVGIGYTED